MRAESEGEVIVNDSFSFDTRAEIGAICSRAE